MWRAELSDVRSLSSRLDNLISQTYFIKELSKENTTDNEDIPLGWAMSVSEDGIPYYFNENTGESVWDLSEIPA